MILSLEIFIYNQLRWNEENKEKEAWNGPVKSVAFVVSWFIRFLIILHLALK